ncbi:hypothetical protein [Streptomyces hirsutus]|uniref:hypothetical protein n=1 Tax=Streptomyces hirsutus TaxID=35620 RepID=UPI0006E2A814|nr:hypothetical protein [Streptomyces hirsutus]
MSRRSRPPLKDRRITFLGRYLFNIKASAPGQELRPFRNPDANEDDEDRRPPHDPFLDTRGRLAPYEVTRRAEVDDRSGASWIGTVEHGFNRTAWPRTTRRTTLGAIRLGL